MEVIAIAAMDRGHVIGNGESIPWRIQQDLQYFKAQTLGHAVIMGRKTWRTLPKSLTGRQLIVVTREPEKLARVPSIMVASSPEEALEMARHWSNKHGLDRIFVAGGGELYRALFDECTHLYLTEIDISAPGITTFPEVDVNSWVRTHRENHADGKLLFSFNIYARR